MLIAFVHRHKAFLPQINAYQRFFHERNFETIEIFPGEAANRNAEIYWYFMGIYPFAAKKKGSLTVHEYSSASLPPFSGLKNALKRSLNSSPDFRLFLNPAVKECFAFRDTIPYGFMDVGIDQELINLSMPEPEKVWDFIFAGGITTDMNFHVLLDRFTAGPLKTKSLLVISNHYEALKVKYRQYSNIIFIGPLPRKEVYPYLRQARFAINYKPLKEPYLHQTSTKILEYAACRIPILTVKTPWAEGFEKESGSRHYYLEEDLSNLDWESINRFNYQFPDLSRYTWEEQIRRSGILEFIKSRTGY